LVLSGPELSFVAVLRGGQSQEYAVLPGSYRLAYGLVFDAARKQVTGGVAGGDLKPVEAAKGRTSKFQVGGPFVLGIEASLAGNRVMVEPVMQVRGSQGEGYYGLTISRAEAPAVNLSAGGKMFLLGRMEYG
jgi:hypothetical protein